MLTGSAGSVTGVGRAGIAIVGACRTRVAGGVGAGGTRGGGPGGGAVARFVHVALVDMGAAHSAGRLLRIGRAGVARAVAGLGHVADASGCAADRASDLDGIGRAVDARPGAVLGYVAPTHYCWAAD